MREGKGKKKKRRRRRRYDLLEGRYFFKGKGGGGKKGFGEENKFRRGGKGKENLIMSVDLVYLR